MYYSIALSKENTLHSYIWSEGRRALTEYLFTEDESCERRGGVTRYGPQRLICTKNPRTSQRRRRKTEKGKRKNRNRKGNAAHPPPLRILHLLPSSSSLDLRRFQSLLIDRSVLHIHLLYLHPFLSPTSQLSSQKLRTISCGVCVLIWSSGGHVTAIGGSELPHVGSLLPGLTFPWLNDQPRSQPHPKTSWGRHHSHALQLNTPRDRDSA